MRSLVAVVAALLLVACVGVDTDEPVSSATVQRPPPSQTSSTRQATTAPEVTTMTGSIDAPDSGGESIGVTDKVTIVITDPEDG